MRNRKQKNPLANRLNKRLEVWGTVPVENELGAIENKTVKVKTIWGQIVPQTGSIGQRAGTEFAKMTHKVIVRYSAARDITPVYHIRYAGRKYEIMYILNPYEKNVELEIFVTEVME